MLTRQLALAVSCLLTVNACTPNPDDAIRDALMRESIESYRGECPCPQSIDSKGRKCGDHSAYRSKGGGRRPLCYPSDVTESMLKRYRGEHPETQPAP